MSEEKILNDSEKPKYIQLREILRNQIEEGEYSPGFKIPSENELVEMYGIHRLTVRNAITALVKEGLLKPVQGKGVFVAGKKLRSDLNRLSGFRNKMQEQGAMPETQTLFKTVRPAGVKYAQILGIDPEDEIFYFRRLYFADQEPISLEDIYIPKSIAPELENVDLDVISLFDILRSRGINISNAWQTLSVTQLDAKDSRWLKIDQDQVVFLFECVSRDEQGRVIEFNRSYSRSDTTSYTVNYEKLE
jgi:GntR family transcriptional regulator